MGKEWGVLCLVLSHWLGKTDFQGSNALRLNAFAPWLGWRKYSRASNR